MILPTGILLDHALRVQVLARRCLRALAEHTQSLNGRVTSDALHHVLRVGQLVGVAPASHAGQVAQPLASHGLFCQESRLRGHGGVQTLRCIGPDLFLAHDGARLWRRGLVGVARLPEVRVLLVCGTSSRLGCESVCLVLEHGAVSGASPCCGLSGAGVVESALGGSDGDASLVGAVSKQQIFAMQYSMLLRRQATVKGHAGLAQLECARVPDVVGGLVVHRDGRILLVGVRASLLAQTDSGGIKRHGSVGILDVALRHVAGLRSGARDDVLASQHLLVVLARKGWQFHLRHGLRGISRRATGKQRLLGWDVGQVLGQLLLAQIPVGVVCALAHQFVGALAQSTERLRRIDVGAEADILPGGRIDLEVLTSLRDLERLVWVGDVLECVGDVLGRVGALSLLARGDGVHGLGCHLTEQAFGERASAFDDSLIHQSGGLEASLGDSLAGHGGHGLGHACHVNQAGIDLRGLKERPPRLRVQGQVASVGQRSAVRLVWGDVAGGARVVLERGACGCQRVSNQSSGNLGADGMALFDVVEGFTEKASGGL